MLVWDVMDILTFRPAAKASETCFGNIWFTSNRSFSWCWCTLLLASSADTSSAFRAWVSSTALGLLDGSCRFDESSNANQQPSIIIIIINDLKSIVASACMCSVLVPLSRKHQLALQCYMEWSLECGASSDIH